MWSKCLHHPQKFTSKFSSKCHNAKELTSGGGEWCKKVHLYGFITSLRGYIGTPTCGDRGRRGYLLGNGLNQTSNLGPFWSWALYPVDLWEMNICYIDNGIFTIPTRVYYAIVQNNIAHLLPFLPYSQTAHVLFPSMRPRKQLSY